MIASVTVTYQPDLIALRQQLVSLQWQVQKMFVVDNGSTAPLRQELTALCLEYDADLEVLPYNSGIAHAQNIGIGAALAQNASLILLMDQDSESVAGMVDTLAHALNESPQAAAAGPRSIDRRTGHSSFLIDTGIWPRLCALDQKTPHDPIEVGFLISSGTLIRVQALGSATPMQSDWFIDHVDSEWCLRVRSQGWKLLGVPNAHLMHRLGDEVTKIWFLRWRQVAHHSPLRDYYMFRNSIFLVKKNYVQLRWKLFFLSRLFQYAGFFLIFTPKRIVRAKMMMEGLLDGLSGKAGTWQ